MRRAARLTVICGCMAMLGGCGAEKAADKVGRTVDPVAEAAQKTTASGGARMQGGIDIRVEGVTVPMTINGEISFEDQALQMRMNMGRIKGATQADMAAGRREGGFPIELVQTPDEVFVSTGHVREKGKKDGIEWIRLDLEELDEEAGLDLQRANQFSEVNPDALLRFLRTTGDARKTGTATIRGERTDRYEGTIDLERYPELVPEEDKAAARRTVDIMVKSWGGTKHPISVFINDAGMIVREKMPIEFEEGGDLVKGTVVIDLVDVGSPQEIELPDRDDVVDVTDEAAERFGK
jgi:hypothetical protein